MRVVGACAQAGRRLPTAGVAGMRALERQLAYELRRTRRLELQAAAWRGDERAAARLESPCERCGDVPPEGAALCEGCEFLEVVGGQ